MNTTSRAWINVIGVLDLLLFRGALTCAVEQTQELRRRPLGGLPVAVLRRVKVAKAGTAADFPLKHQQAPLRGRGAEDGDGVGGLYTHDKACHSG